MANRSRLSRHLDSQRRNQTIILLVIIVVIIGLLFRFSSEILDGVGSVLLNINEEQEITEPTKSLTQIQPPTLEAEFKATDSATMQIFGKAPVESGTVVLLVNNKTMGEKDFTDSEFSFKSIKLSDGQNIIRARIIVNNEESDLSEELVIQKIDEEVKIDELSPSDGQEFKKGDERIEISGKTSPPNNKVTVNGFRAIVDNDGKFSYMLQLHDGDNEVKVVAESLAGKKVEQIIHVKFTP